MMRRQHLFYIACDRKPGGLGLGLKIVGGTCFQQDAFRQIPPSAHPPALNCPESRLTDPRGHLWRDKWTALSGPLSLSPLGRLGLTQSHHSWSSDPSAQSPDTPSRIWAGAERARERGEREGRKSDKRLHLPSDLDAPASRPPSPTQGPSWGVSQSQFFRDVVNIWRSTPTK